MYRGPVLRPARAHHSDNIIADGYSLHIAVCCCYTNNVQRGVVSRDYHNRVRAARYIDSIRGNDLDRGDLSHIYRCDAHCHVIDVRSSECDRLYFRGALENSQHPRDSDRQDIVHYVDSKNCCVVKEARWHKRARRCCCDVYAICTCCC